MTSNVRLVEQCPKDAATTNCVCVSLTDKLTKYELVEAVGFVFNVVGHREVPDNCVALNSVQRKLLRVAVRDNLELTPYVAPPTLPAAAAVYGDVSYVTSKGAGVELSADSLTSRLIRSFQGQVLTSSQVIAFEHEGVNYRLTVNNLQTSLQGEVQDTDRAYLSDKSTFVFTNSGQNPIKITGQKGLATTQLFKTKKLNFEQLGIGGLDKQFEAIFRRAFASRVFPAAIIQKMGIQHVKGILLFGPPGTGKTLIARQIGKMLNGREPKIVNGPEVLNKYVGQSEENIRNLFAEADAEYKEKGDASELHIIIFDEIDAVCKQRGSVRDGSGVHDTVVNQLLTKIDGVDALNNILLIGMTNRRDMLDEALLRPGRLEVQIEIGLPDQSGRLQILKIHTNKMSENAFIARDVDLQHLSEATKNFSGAEIEGLVKDAAAYALNRQVDFENLSKPLDADAVKVTMDDFRHALKEVKPAFGAATETLTMYRVHDMLPCGEVFDHIGRMLQTLVQQVKSSDKTRQLSCMLEGPRGSGKSALAATAAIDSDFPFIKVINPEMLVGYNEQMKSSQIIRVFEDAYRSPLSIIILDDIELLFEYVAIGPRFSNTVLQTLLVMTKRVPPPDHRLLIIGTSSAGDIFDSMGISGVFNYSLHVPALRLDEVVRVLRSLDVFAISDIPDAVDSLTTHCGKTVPMKKLLVMVDSAKQGLEKGQRIPLARWRETLQQSS